MREITELMIIKYKLLLLKFDFMGYEFDKKKELTFHHLIVPKRECNVRSIPNSGYVMWNGAIIQRDAHDYLHIVERYDRDMFESITNEMVDENRQGYLDMTNIRAIDDVLQCFEREYCGATTKKGKPLIKEEYTRRRVRR